MMTHDINYVAMYCCVIVMTHITRDVNSLEMTHKCFIIRPQLNNNPPTSMIQLNHKHAIIFFNQKIIKHSFLEINEILQ